MAGLFVTATGTDVGKTYVACAVLRALVRGDWPADALKPVLSGFDPQACEESDAGLLLHALGRPIGEVDAISPYRYREPLAPPSAARAEGAELRLQDLRDLCRKRLAEAGERLLLIEGAGGVMSPIAEGATNLDLMAGLDVPALLVTGSYLGAISHTLTALLALDSRGVPVLGVAVSVSAGEAPPPSEVMQALAAFRPDIPAFLVPRAVDYDAAPIVARLVEEEWV